MIVKIISGGCDIYPKGSYQSVESIQSRKVIGRLDVIPFDYQIEESNITHGQKCPECLNNFDLDHPFLFSSINQKEICIRCWERIHVTGDRDAYRKAVEKMVRDDIDNQQPDRYEQIGE